MGTLDESTWSVVPLGPYSRPGSADAYLGDRINGEALFFDAFFIFFIFFIHCFIDCAYRLTQDGVESI